MRYLFSLALLMTLSTPSIAQHSLDDQIALMRQSAHADRKLMLMGNLQFAPGESEQFWPAWDAYRAAMAANGDRRVALIRNFAQNYEEMDNQRASRLLTDSFSIQMQNVVIKQNFSKKIAVFMPATKVMRIIQIENKMDAAIEMKLAAEIPLAK